jgi:hypothetical protein
LQPISVFTLFYFFAMQPSGSLRPVTSTARHVGLAAS